ncbi:type II toxin-antitoxin system VapC family toxin [Patescibacteria group bacterium]|nr:type II toxin-antitoxin system VapC family toxin [Patescibacteria group bacterium]
MNKCYLDSNFLIYFKNESSPYHQQAVKTISKLVGDYVMLFISPLVIDEFLHSFSLELKKGRIKDIYANLKRALQDILSIPDLCLINPPLEKNSQIEVITLMRKYNLRARDAYHFLIMQANDIPFFATFDTDFEKVFATKSLSKI